MPESNRHSRGQRKEQDAGTEERQRADTAQRRPGRCETADWDTDTEAEKSDEKDQKGN